MTPGDALTLTLLPAQLGISMASQELVDALGDGGDNAALAQRLDQQRRVLAGNGDAMRAQLDDIDAALARAGLPIPARPDAYPAYVTWSAAILQSLALRADSAEGALAALGKAAGDLLQSVAVDIVALFLLEAAPGHERLTAQHALLRTSRAAVLARVTALAAGPALPPATRPAAARLAALAGALGTVDEGAASSVSLHHAALRAAFTDLAQAAGDLRRYSFERSIGPTSTGGSTV